MPSTRFLAPFAFILVAAGATAGGCATAVTNSSGAGGASTTDVTSSSSASSSSHSSSSTGMPGSCTGAADCVSFADACNDGACINGKCGKIAKNELGACDDGKFCTDNDTCMKGVCVGGTPHVCASSDACHVASCDAAQDKCVEVAGNDGAQCPSPDLCSQSGVCQGGVCGSGKPVDCSFFDDACGTGKCDPVNGCVKVPNPDNTPCDDGLFCTVADRCMAGKCGGDPNMCAPPGTPCQVGVCNEALKTCTPGNAPDGSACSTGNLCLGSETCLMGKCQGGAPANNGMACNDGNGCDIGTTCNNGVCGGPTMVITQCIDGDKCCPPACAMTDKDCSPILVGSYQIGMGVQWTMNPPTYTCLEACAVVFGGLSTDYACSTQAGMVDHKAWCDGYADTQHCQGNNNPVAENYKLNSNYDCGIFGCSYSAYVHDNCPSSTNYCFKLP